MFDTVGFAEEILQKVVRFEANAMDRIMTHAEALHEQQKLIQYQDIKPHNSFIPNPITLLQNMFARAVNESIKHSREKYFVPIDVRSDFDCSVDSRDPMDTGPYMLSPNMLKALVYHVERDRERLMKHAGITRADLHKLRDMAGWDNRVSPITRERHV